MRLLMVTNTFTPHVGGVARSVERFTAEYRRLGHRVVVVAPRFPGRRHDEPDVVRFPAVQRFNGSDFSFPMPAPGLLAPALDELRPEVAHSHHPFLLGDTALRVAAARELPVVFTHHTLYERYTHYVPGDAPGMQRAAVELATGYCNLCDAVIAPSETVAGLLRERGVERRIEVIPTGVDLACFSSGDGEACRRRLGIPTGAFVLGHVGRLAPEKNLELLTAALARFLVTGDAHLLLAGGGPSRDAMLAELAALGVAARVHPLGVLAPRELAEVYAAIAATRSCR